MKSSTRLPVLLVYLSAATSASWILTSSHVTALARLGLCVAALAMFAASVVRAGKINGRHIVIASVMVLGSAACVAPRGSGDVYMYSMFGSVLANHGVSPYQHAPDQFQTDPLLAPTVPVWQHVRSPYGPVFTGLSAAVAWVYADSPTAAYRTFQVLDVACLAGLALILCRRQRSAQASLLVCANPALAAVVNGGHNDIVVGVALVVGVLFAQNRRSWLAGVALALAVGLKVTAIAPVAIILLWMLMRCSRRQFVQAALVAASGSLLAYSLAGTGNVISSLGDSAMTTSRASLWTLPGHVLSHSFMYPLAGLIFVGLLATFGRTWLKNKDASAPVTYLTVAVLFLQPYVLPWYAAPAVLIAAISVDRRVWLVGQIQISALTLAYVSPPGFPSSGLVGVVAATAMPCALAVTVFLGVARHNRKTGSLHAVTPT